MLYLICAVLALATLAYLTWPLLRRSDEDEVVERPDLALYRAQLQELEGEQASGQISADDAASARLEIERRLLRAADRLDDASKTNPVSSQTRTMIAAALVVLIPFSGAGLYLMLGSPDLPSAPAKLAQAQEQPLTESSMDDLIARLAQRLTERPDDLEGWLLLGRTAQTVGKFDLSIRAYENAIRLQPEAPAIYAGLGQSHVGENAGFVSPQARAAFETANAMNPSDPISRYYLGLGDYQQGDYLGAYHRWADLAAQTPPDAPWAEALQVGLARVQQALESTDTDMPATPAAPGPTAEDVAAARDMSVEDRSAMIRGMVEGLAERLKDEPDNLDGWLRLGRAYVVLGEQANARNAYEQVLRLDPGNATAEATLNDLGSE